MPGENRVLFSVRGFFAAAPFLSNPVSDMTGPNHAPYYLSNIINFSHHKLPLELRWQINSIYFTLLTMLVINWPSSPLVWISHACLFSLSLSAEEALASAWFCPNIKYRYTLEYFGKKKNPIEKKKKGKGGSNRPMILNKDKPKKEH